MYPFLAKCLALGQKFLYRYTLILVNLLAVLGSVWIVLLLIDDAGWSRWLAMLYGFMGGFLLCLLRDLTEPTAVFFLTASVFFYRNRQFGRMGMSLACMLLSRENFMLFIAIMALDALVIQRDRRLLLFILLSLLPWLAWNVYIHYRLGGLPCAPGKVAFGIPLQGLWNMSREIMAEGTWARQGYLVVTATAMISAGALAVKEILKARNFFTIALLVFSVFPYTLSSEIWVEPWGYGRIMLPLYAMIFLYGVTSRQKLFMLPAALQPLLFVITAWAEVIVRF